tara:strand:+ start:340 stop:477 length:138 start_codon:yes stop_codon:yes gene_type:complete
MNPLPKHSKQVLLKFSEVLKLPEPQHLEQITFKLENSFSSRKLDL